MNTFYWHDYETWGSDPRRVRAAQFAGVRTDLDLNVVSDPLVLYCQPAPDFLPELAACLITGITPQHAQEKGVLEYQFAAAINRELSTPGTCAVGYNSVRFDDHITRHMLYRNFYDPYDREWNYGNSRWDIIDMVRTCYALRPEGIEWPFHEDGKPSFRLEDIARANGLSHEKTHDALSDVYATIAVAKMIKSKQPKLFDYLFRLRNKQEVVKQINLAEKYPFLHISSMFPAERGCMALMMPLARHPGNWEKEFVCYDLSVNPAPLIELSPEEVRRRVFTSKDKLDVERIPLKTIRTNYCPVICSYQVLDESTSARLSIDRSFCEANRQKILAAKRLMEKINEIYSYPEKIEQTDPDQMLYSGGFINHPSDKTAIRQIRSLDGDALNKINYQFKDSRLPELLFRYRARNFPESLSYDEKKKWVQFCYGRLTDSSDGATIVMDEFQKELLRLKDAVSLDKPKTILLDQLYNYANDLIASIHS